MADLGAHDRSILGQVFGGWDARPSRPAERPTTAAAHPLEIEAARLCDEAHDYEGGLALLDEAAAARATASVLNNRAQVLRLLRRDDEALACLEGALGQAALEANDLVRARASMQRGWIYRRRGQHELARGEFEVAAGLGVAEARALAAQCNPYAALCGSALRQLFGVGRPETAPSE